MVLFPIIILFYFGLIKLCNKIPCFKFLTKLYPILTHFNKTEVFSLVVLKVNDKQKEVRCVQHISK